MQVPVPMRRKKLPAAHLGHPWARLRLFMASIIGLWSRHASISSARSSFLPWVRQIDFGGSEKLCADFKSGLQKTDVNGITYIDKLYPERIKARQDIVDQYPGAVDCMDSGVSMLNELYEFLVQEYLPQRYPTMFRLDKDAAVVENVVTGERLPLAAPADRNDTLRRINRNVEEDFLMMLPSPDGDGYNLQAFVWAYPVGFDPQSKLGIKLRDAHGPVPGYKEKLERSMDRYLGAMEPGNIKYRYNWALATNDNLCERGEYHLAPGQEPTQTHFELDDCRVRCERQTVFALPKSGGKILSVHLYLYPLQEIKDVGLGPEMVQAIDGFNKGNAPGFHHYKRWAFNLFLNSEIMKS